MKLYFMPGACPLASHIVLEWIGAPYETRRMENDAAVRTAIEIEEGVTV